MLLHVAELHECGGLSEQPEAMWGMKGKPQEWGSLGFTGVLGRGRVRSPKLGGREREGASEAEDLGTARKRLGSVRVILTFVSSRVWHIVGVQ